METLLTRLERSIFGKIAKYAFISFNIIMIIVLVFLFSSMDNIDVFSEETYKTEKELANIMMIGTFAYLLFFVWILGDIILGIWVLCTRPKKQISSS